MDTGEWSKLDNAGKIFPPSMSLSNPWINRFQCNLKEEVTQEHLHQALLLTIKIMPYFNVTLKRGFFWYYLDTVSKQPIVTEDNLPLLTPFNNDEPIFRVTYYHKTINLEVSHALTDGLGSLEFFKLLVVNYLNSKYNLNLSLEDSSSLYLKKEDSFDKYYLKPKRKDKQSKTCYHLKGNKYQGSKLKVIIGEVSSAKVLALAHTYEVTITELLTTILAMAIDNTKKVCDKNKPIDILIPVNLRTHFPSMTMKNFFATMTIPVSNVTNLEETITKVYESFQQIITKENLEEKMHSLVIWEKNYPVRLIPLPLKNIILKYLSAQGDMMTTMTLSNLGVIKLPAECTSYIDSFDVFTSTNKIQLCVCTYHDTMTLNFTSKFKHSEVERNFFHLLKELGIDVTIRANTERSR